MSDIELLSKFIEEVNKTNSSNDKKAVIAKYPDLKKMFQYIYDDSIQFGVTPENISKKTVDLSLGTDYADIYDLLDALAQRVITGYAAIASVQKFIANNSEYEDVIYRIIDKDLKTRTDTTLINKVFPNCIRTYDVALANKYNDKKAKVDFKKDCWLASHKLDGCRCNALIDANGNVRMMSRVGKEFFTLGKVIEDVAKLGFKNKVLDGELCLVDENDNESFEGIMKLIKRKDFTIPNPRYKIFDCLTMEEFLAKKGSRILTDRYKDLTFQGKFKTLDIVEQWPIKDEDDFERYRQMARDNNWEGLIIRKNVGYEGKRTDNMLKVKDMQDAEYVVTGIENGKIGIIENGKAVEREMVSKLIIMHKDNPVGVGSGLSQQQRMYYYEHPDEIIGKTITVRYFEETMSDGKYSLRFPILKHIYDEERDV